MQHLRQMLFVHLQLDEHDDKLFDTLGHLICQWQIANEKKYQLIQKMFPIQFPGILKDNYLR